MSALDVLLRLQAVSDGSARERTTMRHRHIDRAPLVLVAYRLAGESVAPLGIMYGTKATKPHLLVAPEPRNREIRFREVFDPFADVICDLFDDRGEVVDGFGWGLTATEGPQIIVPNGATADFIGHLVGRSLRYLDTEGEYAVPFSTVLAGAHLTWLANQAELPGSSVLLSATDLLRRHWVTGLSDLESEDLQVQLGWIDPPNGVSGAEAAARAEQDRGNGVLPASGPTPDPAWDRDILDPLIAAFNQARDGAQDDKTVKRLGRGVTTAVREALAPTWDATWRSIELLRAKPVAPSVEGRWAEDRRSFAHHMERVETGSIRFRIKDSVKQAAMIVRQREDAQAALDAAEALDDPMVLAGSIADGSGITGEVVDLDRYDLTIDLDRPCPVPVGTELYWTDLPGKASAVVAAVRTEPPFEVTLELKKGKTKYRPAPGEVVTYSPHRPPTYRAPGLPGTVPWTHVGPEQVDPGPEVQE